MKLIKYLNLSLDSDVDSLVLHSKNFSPALREINLNDVDCVLLVKNSLGGFIRDLPHSEVSFYKLLPAQSPHQAYHLSEYTSEISGKMQGMYKVPSSVRKEIVGSIESITGDRINEYLSFPYNLESVLCNCVSAFHNNFIPLKLKNVLYVLKSLEIEEFVTCLILDPYIMSILGVQVFVSSVKIMYTSHFYKKLFKILASSFSYSYSYLYSSINSYFFLPISSTLLATTVYLSYKPSISPYKFNGDLGECINSFQDLGKKIIYNVCSTYSIFRTTVLRALFDPLVEILKEYRKNL